MFLQSLSYFIRAGSISRSFYHADHFCFRPEHGTIVIQVRYHSTQIHFQYRLMHFQFQSIRNQIKVECTRTLYQNHFIVQAVQKFWCHQFVRSMEKILFHIEACSRGTNFRSHTDNLFNAPALYQLGHFTVKCRRTLSGFQNIRKDKRTFHSFCFGTTYQKVKSNIKWSQIGIITIIDKYTSLLSLLHLQTHGHGLETYHSFCYLIGRHHQIKTGCQAIEWIFDRCIINERDTEGIIHFQITIWNNRMIFFLQYLAYI